MPPSTPATAFAGRGIALEGVVATGSIVCDPLVALEDAAGVRNGPGLAARARPDAENHRVSLGTARSRGAQSTDRRRRRRAVRHGTQTNVRPESQGVGARSSSYPT